MRTGPIFTTTGVAVTPWGHTRPDYGRGEVRTFIRDNAMMWVEDYHFIGLRYDMTVYIRTVPIDGSEKGDSLAARRLVAGPRGSTATSTRNIRTSCWGSPRTCTTTSGN